MMSTSKVKKPILCCSSPPGRSQQKMSITLKLFCSELDCVWSGKNDLELNGHMMRVHQIKRYRCLVRHCGLSFAASPFMEKHVTVNHRSGKLECYLCSKGYADHNMLAKHYTLVHLRGVFQCSRRDCSDTFETQQGLLKHRIRYHLKGRGDQSGGRTKGGSREEERRRRQQLRQANMEESEPIDLRIKHTKLVKVDAWD